LTRIKAPLSAGSHGCADAGLAPDNQAKGKPGKGVRQFTIRRGLKGERRGAPAQGTIDKPDAVPVALMGADLQGIRPDLRVTEGEAVAAGQTLFVDRARPAVHFVAPIGGTVTGIELGRRRTLSSLVITPGDKPATEGGDGTDIDDGDAVRSALLARGLWPAFVTRPFGRIPDPDVIPDAIFVNAVRHGPLAPDPATIVARRPDAFRTGLSALTRLTGGMVHLCQGPGEALCSDAPARVDMAVFGGRSAASLAGTHVDRLHPVRHTGQVWSIGFQDVIAIGHLLATGEHDATRVVAMAGPRAARPRLLAVPLGASLKALTAGEVASDRRGRPATILSGAPDAGRPGAYLGRHHTQITITDRRDAPAGAAGGPRAIIPTATLNGALGFAAPPVPLMRALSVGDAEAAARLGCRAMIEEDVGALSRLCASGADYGVLLREVLEALEREAA
jgi:Na+-transporting NADH:ubiquinone oxidoreductase subunit A